MTSIFRLEEVRAYENDEQLYRDASIGILGHYSSLGNALDAIHRNSIETYEPDDIYASSHPPRQTGRSRLHNICEIEGHQYLYNFATLPSKSICRRCHQKWLADYSGDLINGEVWKEVNEFEGDARSDEELIKVWGGH